MPVQEAACLAGTQIDDDDGTPGAGIGDVGKPAVGREPDIV
jgi:hypothetical protein